MPTLSSVANIFSPDTDIIASEVNTNFTELVTFVNTNLIQKDATLAMTAALSLVGADPTADNHATRKSYVDANHTDVLRVPLITGTKDILVTAWTDVPVTTGSSSLSFTKALAATKLVVHIEGSGFDPFGDDPIILVGVEINSTDHELTRRFMGEVNVHYPFSGDKEITGLAAASWTVQLRYRLVSGSGPIFRFNGWDQWSLKVTETL